MREMKDSGIYWIGDIPVNWELLPTKRFFRAEKRVVGAAVDDYDRLALTMQGVIKRSKDDSEGLQPEKFEGYQILRENELVFKLIDLENVKTSRVGLSSYTGLVSPAYIVLTNDQKDNRYFYYWFMFMYYNEVFNQLGGAGVRSALNAKDVCALPVPAIGYEIQKRISDYLDSKCSKIDEIIYKQEQIIEKLKEYKLSVITETVTNGINPSVEKKDSGIEFIGRVPQNWSVLKFGYCVSIKSNLVAPDNYKKYFQIAPDCIEKGSAKLIDVKTVEEAGVISWNHLFYKGQIIYSKIRPLLDKVVIAQFDGLCSADMYPMETENNSRFIVYVILSGYFHSQVALVTENRVKMPKINQNELSDIMIALPSIEEQDEIADYLDRKCEEIDRSIQSRQSIIEKLQKYKKSLIYELVTGKKEIAVQ